jgi:hypothetical protein
LNEIIVKMKEEKKNVEYLNEMKEDIKNNINNINNTDISIKNINEIITQIKNSKIEYLNKK